MDQNMFCYQCQETAGCTAAPAPVCAEKRRMWRLCRICWCT